jgi:hypothetical protein
VKIAEKKDDAPPPAGYPPEEIKSDSQVSAAPMRASEEKFADEPVGMSDSFAGRDELFNPVSEQKQPNSVVASYSSQNESRSNFRCQFTFQFPLRPEHQRRANVNDDEDPQLTLVPKLFDIRFAHACRHIPVNHPHIVAHLILPNLFKLQALPLEDAFVSAEKHLADEPSQFHFQPLHSPQNFSW